MAKLIVISGDERQEFELAAFNTIGRHPDNTIQILDRIISKEHAHIQRAADGRYLLRDLRSLNGTFMRGERVSDHYLSDGDEIVMGSTRILFVDKPRVDDALQRVTIAPGLTESHIRGRIQANTGDFMPERQIADDKILRRDYERLRIGHELARAVGSELDLDKLLPKILDKAFELVGADRGAIMLIDERGLIALERDTLGLVRERERPVGETRGFLVAEQRVAIRAAIETVLALVAVESTHALPQRWLVAVRHRHGGRKTNDVRQILGQLFEAFRKHRTDPIG